MTAAVARKTSRSLHQWAAWVASVPLFVIIVTGIALQSKSFVPWIQPKAVKGIKAPAPTAGWDRLLEAARSVPEAQVNGWEDIRVVDARPGSGVARLRTVNDYEIQVDLTDGRMLKAAPRRTSWIIALHEGSFFGDAVKYGIFLPASILLLLLWISGIVLALSPYLPKRRRASADEPCDSHVDRIISSEPI
jgi:uncharacterized iron-regulated membrane protein